MSEFSLGRHQLTAKGLGKDGAGETFCLNGGSMQTLLKLVGKLEDGMNAPQNFGLFCQGWKTDQGRTQMVEAEVRTAFAVSPGSVLALPVLGRVQPQLDVRRHFWSGKSN
ncbi:MAG TPA: hypothetical protein VFS43_13315 [Polyangiaceae bacterium]|nr:hypothetical protein [Polyangiaceae bacterium]